MYDHDHFHYLAWKIKGIEHELETREDLSAAQEGLLRSHLYNLINQYNDDYREQETTYGSGYGFA